ncbi:MAG: proteasome activator [Actinomycetes bacterium]
MAKSDNSKSESSNSDAEESVIPEVLTVVTPDVLNEEATEQVTQPSKLIRIATMVRTMLDEVRRAPLDDAGRRALREIHERSLRELQGVLSPDLQEELAKMVLPFSSETPSESELRVSQAQLVGWLEGLFHGIQASLFTQQAMAQQQLEEMRNPRSLEMGMQTGSGPGNESNEAHPPGAYL